MSTGLSASGNRLDDTGFTPDLSDEDSLDLEPRERASISGSVKSMSQGAVKGEADDLAEEDEGIRRWPQHAGTEKKKSNKSV